MRKYISIILSLIIIILPFTSCNDSTGTVYYFENDYIPKSLDPQIATDSLALNIIYNTNEGLFSIAPDGNVQNAIASGYTKSVDGLTYIVTLNPDKKWEDDSAIVANDFIFSIKRILDKTSNSPYYKSMLPIKNASKIYYSNADISTLGLTAPDEHTLVFTLEKADDTFMYQLATSPFFPCKESFFTSCNGKYGIGTDFVLSSGHFKLNSFSEKKVEIDRNENYIGTTKTLPTSILFSLSDKPNPSESSGSDSSSSGVTDIERINQKVISGAAIDYDLLESAQQSGLNVIKSTNSTYTLCLNKNDPLFVDENMRAAFMMSINTPEFNLSENMKTTNTVFPPNTTLNMQPFTTKSIDEYIAFDPVKSKELFSKVATDFSNDELNFTLYYPDIYGMEDIAISIAQNWQEHLNAYINIEAKSVYELRSMFASGTIKAAIMPISGVTNDALMFMEQFKSDSINNIYQFNDTNFDKYTNDLITNNTLENNDTLLQQESLLYSSYCFYPLVYSSDYYVYNKAITGVEQLLSTNIWLLNNMIRTK